MDLSKLDMEKVVNLTFCAIILLLGLKRWRKEGIRAFIFVGLGFTLFGVTHVLALANGQGMLTKETWEMLKTPQIWIRGIGYFLVLLGMLV